MSHFFAIGGALLEPLSASENAPLLLSISLPYPQFEGCHPKTTPYAHTEVRSNRSKGQKHIGLDRSGRELVQTRRRERARLM
jgi:hypothetical protein